MKLSISNTLLLALSFALCLSRPIFATDAPSNKSTQYVYTEKGEELIDGSQSSITWTFILDVNNGAMVNITSWHSPFSCNGKYKVITKGNELHLYWLQKQNKDINCNVPSPQFILKKQDNSMLVKSDCFYYGEGKWFPLEDKNRNKK